MGGRGSGKTRGGALLLLHDTQFGRSGDTSLVIAPTYRNLLDVVIPEILRYFSYFVPRSAFIKSDMMMVLPNGGRILFRSADDPERIRGITAARLWIDEAAILSRRVYEIAWGCIREGGRDGRAFVTTTPRGRNWLYQRFCPSSARWVGNRCINDDTFLLQVSSFENPFLSDRVLRRWAAIWTGQFFEQELLGKFVKFDGAAFPFDEKTHIVPIADLPPLDEFEELGIGIDEGTTNPRAAGLWGTRSDGSHVCVWEHYASEEPDHVFADMMEHLFYGKEGWADLVEDVRIDKSARQLRMKLEDRGISVYSGKNERIPSIRFLKSQFETFTKEGNPMISFSEACVHHISEFTNAVHVGTRPRGGGGETVFTEDIVKMNDHAIDETRYYLYSRFGRRSGAFVQ